MSKVINTRIQYKADTEASWSSSSFISQPGEIYEYLPDSNYEFSRLKIGDGIHTVSELPFTEVGEMGPPEPDLIPVKLPEAAAENEAVYTGSEVIPMWVDMEANDDQYWADHTDSDKITISGQTSGINAGTYTANFTPNDGYCWEDGTTETKAVQWTIQKATPYLTLSSLTNGESSETNFDVAVGGQFTLAAKYPSYVDSDKVEFSFVNGTGAIQTHWRGPQNSTTYEYEVHGLTAGSATATVTLLATDNYNSVSKTVTINVTECQHDGGEYTETHMFDTPICKGETVHYCSICNAQLSVEEVHVPNIICIEYVTGDCSNQGYETWGCEYCGEVDHTEYFGFGDHNYEVQPGSPWYDYGPDGMPTAENWDYVCSICSDSYTDTIPV